MEKNLVYSELLDIYKGLLTDRQAEALDYYYNKDYSLGEISELMDISRQGVRDFVKRGELIMDETESKLKLLGKMRAMSAAEHIAKEIKKVNKRLSESKEINSLADRIIDSVKQFEDGE